MNWKNKYLNINFNIMIACLLKKEQGKQKRKNNCSVSDDRNCSMDIHINNCSYTEIGKLNIVIIRRY